MKETTSELNLTLIVVMAIGVLVAFFYFVIWPGVNSNFQANSACSRAWCENPCGENSSENACDDAFDGLATCWIGEKNVGTRIMCPWKG